MRCWVTGLLRRWAWWCGLMTSLAAGPSSVARAVGLLQRTALASGLVLTVAVAAPAWSANLAEVRGAQLPPLPDAALASSSATAVSPPGLAVVAGTPLAWRGNQAWLLAADGKSWQPTAGGGWPTAPQAVVGDSERAFVLLSPAAPADVVGVGAGAGVQSSPAQSVNGTPLLRLTLEAGQVRTQPWPRMPVKLAGAQATLLADALWVAGQPAQGAWQLWQVDAGTPGAAWKRVADVPEAGALSSLVGQSRAVYATQAAADGQGPHQLLRWVADTGWQRLGAVPGQVLSGAARATGQAHLLYLVRPVALAGQPQPLPRLMTYHTITSAWALQDDVPALASAAQATGFVAWGNGLLWPLPDAAADRPPSGAAAVPVPPSAGASRGFVHAQIEAGKLLLKPLDWLVIAIYLFTMLGIGLHFYLREKRNSTADFFVGGRSIPFWAAGVSLYATNTSSISFIAIPAKAFETNWQYLTNNLVAVVGLVFVATWVVPLLRRLDLMSVYSYLETRFHPAIRMLASALAIVMQIGSRMSVVLFLPALAIATITGLDVTWSVWIMGGITILYTALGGMKAVIWTDFVQMFVMFGGALFAIGYCVLALDGGAVEFWRVAAAEEKTKLFDFSFDLTQATVWGFIFLVLFDVVLTFPKDQVLMQRVLSTKSGKDAGRSIWMFGAIMIPGGFMFYMIGTALYAYYKAHPERMNPLLSIDATFPLFIAAELPMGVTGLIIAGIFAAAMSTLSSIINSVATMASVDFYERLAKNPTPRKSVLFAEAATVVAGLVGIAAALMLARYDIRSLFDVSIELAGLLGGGFAGAYTLGMFTRRANSPGVAIGVGSAIVLTTIAWWFKLVHPYFYLAISIMLCIVIGYIASLFFPAPTRSLKGLTIYADT